MITEELGYELKSASLDMLGRAKSVKINKDNTTIIDGMGEKALIDERVRQIKVQMEETTSEFDKEKLSYNFV